MKIVGNANGPTSTLAEVYAGIRNLKTLIPNCQLLQNAANCIAVVPDAADNFSMFIPWHISAQLMRASENSRQGNQPS